MFEKLFQIECLLYSCSPSSDVGPYIVRKLSDRSSSLEGRGGFWEITQFSGKRKDEQS